MAFFGLRFGPEVTRNTDARLIHKAEDDAAWGHSGKHARVLNQFCRFLGRMDEEDRKLLLSMAQKMGVKRRMAK